MLITNVLRDEHKAVEGLFNAYNESHSPEVLNKIEKELSAHAKLEELVVYPLFAAHLEAELVAHSIEEHNEIRQHLALAMSADQAGTAEHVAKLEEAVKHHVEEEETKIFPAAEQKINAEELKQAAVKYASEKAVLS